MNTPKPTYMLLLLRRFLVGVLLLLSSTTAFAQTMTCNPNTGAFTISQTIGCDSTITVSNTIQGARSIGYYFDFDGDFTNRSSYVQANDDGVATYTYKGFKTYKIVQIGTVDGEGFAYCSDIRIIDTSAPIAKVQSCVSQDISVEFIDFEVNTQYDKLGINWGDNTPIEYILKGQELTRKHTYARQGAYAISVFGEYNGNNCSRGRILELGTYEVGAALAIQDIMIQKVEFSNDNLLVTVTNLAQLTASLQTQTTNGSTFENTESKTTAPGKQSLTLQNANAIRNVRLKLEDYCSNIYLRNALSVVHLTVTNQGEQNVLAWSQNAYPDQFLRYEVYKNGRLVTTINTIDRLEYIDQSIVCGEENTYQVIAYQLNETEVSSHSREIAVSGTATDATIPTDLFVSVQDATTIALETGFTDSSLPTTFSFLLDKQASNSTSEEILLENATTWTDLAVTTATTQYCYSAAFINSCEHQSLSTPTVCSIHLTSNGMELSWSTQAPSLLEPISWELEKTLNNQLVVLPMTNLTSYSIASDLDLDGRPQYRIVATDATGRKSYSNSLIYESAPTLYVPTAFSPNNDQHNDLFLPIGQVYNDFKMTIYNRWGKPIYATYNAEQGWDGTVNGALAPAGNYSYDIQVMKEGKSIFRKTGTFLLIR